MADFEWQSVRRKPLLCRNGLHDLNDPANVALRSNGEQRCRPCHNARNRELHERKKNR